MTLYQRRLATIVRFRVAWSGKSPAEVVDELTQEAPMRYGHAKSWTADYKLISADELAEVIEALS